MERRRRITDKQSATAGFSLLELLITLGAIAALMSMSIPAFRTLLNSTQMDLRARELTRLIQLGRVSAIRSNHLVTMCRSAAGDACNGKWRDGIIIFIDRDGDRKLDKDEELVRYHRFLDFNGEIQWRAFQNRQYLQFTPQGFTRYQNGNFTLCPADKNIAYARQLIVNRTARVRFAEDSNGDGIREDSQGRPLRCG